MSKKNGTPDEAKGPRLISIDLPAAVSNECAEVSKATGLPESKVREMVRACAHLGAIQAVADVKGIVKANMDVALA